MERIKLKEHWLREEIRASRTILLSLLKWGVAVLAGIASSLYYVRRDVANHLATASALPNYGAVPAGRWYVGTAFLMIVAFIFCTLSRYVIKRHVAYRMQLLEMKPSFSNIQEPPAGGKINKLHYCLFFAIPAFDFVLWFYFRATGSITIPW